MLVALALVLAIAPAGAADPAPACHVDTVHMTPFAQPVGTCVPLTCKVRFAILDDGTVDDVLVPDECASVRDAIVWGLSDWVFGSPCGATSHAMTLTFFPDPGCDGAAEDVIPVGPDGTPLTSGPAPEPAPPPTTDPGTMRWTAYEAPAGPPQARHDYDIFGGKCIVDAVLPANAATPTIADVDCDRLLRTAVEDAAGHWAFEPAPTDRRVRLMFLFAADTPARLIGHHPALP